jgi:hypothetical protein
MLRIYIIGISILLIAIIANILVDKIGLSTWYDFGPNFFSNPFDSIKNVGFFSCLWLFVFLSYCISCGLFNRR